MFHLGELYSTSCTVPLNNLTTVNQSFEKMFQLLQGFYNFPEMSDILFLIRDKNRNNKDYQ